MYAVHNETKSTLLYRRFGCIPPPRNVFKMVHLMRFDVYFDLILPFKKIQKIQFFYIKMSKFIIIIERFLKIPFFILKIKILDKCLLWGNSHEETCKLSR